MKVVHLGTTVQTHLGVLDEDGNVVNKKPLSTEFNKLTPEVWAEYLKAIDKAKNNLFSEED